MLEDKQFIWFSDLIYNLSYVSSAIRVLCRFLRWELNTGVNDNIQSISDRQFGHEHTGYSILIKHTSHVLTDWIGY